MAEVKRYSCCLNKDGSKFQMVDLDGGKYVLFTEYAKLEAELTDIKESYEATINEACSGGIKDKDLRVHCTCVPPLRTALKASNKRVKELEEELHGDAEYRAEADKSMKEIETMPIEQVNAELKKEGIDPVKLVDEARTLIRVVIEKAELEKQIEALTRERDEALNTLAYIRDHVRLTKSGENYDLMKAAAKLVIHIPIGEAKLRGEP